MTALFVPRKNTELTNGFFAVKIIEKPIFNALQRRLS